MSTPLLTPFFGGAADFSRGNNYVRAKHVSLCSEFLAFRCGRVRQTVVLPSLGKLKWLLRDR